MHWAIQSGECSLAPPPLPRTASLSSAIPGVPPLPIPLAGALHFCPGARGGGSRVWRIHSFLLVWFGFCVTFIPTTEASDAAFWESCRVDQVASWLPPPPQEPAQLFLCFFVMRALKIYSLGIFQICTRVLTVAPMLYVTSQDLFIS